MSVCTIKSACSADIRNGCAESAGGNAGGKSDGRLGGGRQREKYQMEEWGGPGPLPPLHLGLLLHITPQCHLSPP